ncbi:DNA topoisomerase 3-alpha-like [Watersipora subatra]|uniref:DNA topoisomerase 3-alpha-like n=1 Tax=Watersipora subatra TaxID=2589382 RepID=UPI00355C1E53
MFQFCRKHCQKAIHNYITVRYSTAKLHEKTHQMKILNVAEKNDAAKSIAAVMSRGASQRREGFSPYNKIYQFDYMLQGQQVTMNMTSVSGHLQALEFTGQYKQWKSCSPLALFDAPVLKYVPEKFQPIKRTLEREARGAKKLIIWTDCDREGENIGFEVIDVVTKVNPTIQVLRARFSEITSSSINRAISNLVPPDHLQSAAVDVRTELDLRIGAAFTRFLTLRYQAAFPELAEMLISYGSCQFPTLGFVVERYKQIQEFITEPFWKLKVVLEEDGKKVDFNWKRVRLFDYQAVRSFYELCIEQPTATVTEVIKKSKSKWRPVALDTVEFEKNVSRKLRINAKTAMQIAEKLYTAGYISYPRTETNQFSKDYNLRELVQNQAANRDWGDFAGRLLETGITPRNGNKSDQAHPPIHPTKYADNLTGDEKKVYEFITRHFLACCSQDARGFETTVEIAIATEKFTASGLVILERNYLEVYPYEKWSDKDIPNFEKGDLYQPNLIEIQSGQTTPPSLLTEADLIALMEKHGIGTDATHAEHIEKIQERSYAGVQDNKFIPGKLGMGLVEGYDALGFEFSKPYLRAGLEADLKMICDGRRQKEDVLRDQIATYREKFEISLQQVADIDNQMKKYLDTQMHDPGQIQQSEALSPVVRKCPNCGNDMTLRQRNSSSGDQTQQTQTMQGKRASYYIGCMGYPDCRSVMWLPREMQNITVLDSTCVQCGPTTKHLHILFKPGSIPPFIDTDYTGCIMCDTELRDAFDLTLKSSSSNTNQRPSTQRPVARAEGGGRVASRSEDRGRKSGGTTVRAVVNRGTGGSTFSRDSGVYLTPTQSVQGQVNGEGRENYPVCMCGQQAILLTVSKEGPNKGRQFYKCQEGGCNFFSWADQPDTSAGNHQPRGAANQPTTSGGNHLSRGSYSGSNNNPPSRGMHTQRQTDGDGDVLCACSEPAKRLTVRKEGPNTGREFYSCSKPREESCKFFQWADEGSSNISGNAGTSAPGTRNERGRGGARGGAVRGFRTRPVAAGGKRKCGECRQEGHTKKTCPQLPH